MVKKFINEVKLSRVLKHTKNKKIPLGIISASRKENTDKVNKTQNIQLIEQIKSAGFGFFKVEGSFIEDEGKPTEKKVKEDSIFIIGDEDDNGKLESFLIKMIKKFKQESVVFKPVGDVIMFLLEPSGKMFKLGPFRTNIVSDFMSRIKRSKDTFVFESVKVPRNSIEIKLAKIKLEEDYMYKTVWEREII